MTLPPHLPIHGLVLVAGCACRVRQMGTGSSVSTLWNQNHSPAHLRTIFELIWSFICHREHFNWRSNLFRGQICLQSINHVPRHRRETFVVRVSVTVHLRGDDACTTRTVLRSATIATDVTIPDICPCAVLIIASPSPQEISRPRVARLPDAHASEPESGDAPDNAFVHPVGVPKICACPDVMANGVDGPTLVFL